MSYLIYLCFFFIKDIEELEAQLNEIESALDNLENQNDNIHSKLKELLDREIRSEMKSLGMVQSAQQQQQTTSAESNNNNDQSPSGDSNKN